jgi:hypothetical protein
MGVSEPGFLVLDSKLNPVACNQQVIKILAFPNLVDQVKRMSVFLSDKIRVSLVPRQRCPVSARAGAVCVPNCFFVAAVGGV